MYAQRNKIEMEGGDATALFLLDFQMTFNAYILC